MKNFIRSFEGKTFSKLEKLINITNFNKGNSIYQNNESEYLKAGNAKRTKSREVNFTGEHF